MRGRWWSQPFAPEGSTYARSIKNQMRAAAHLDPLTVLVRETAQNTWDARRSGSDPEFRLSLQRLGERSSTWRDMLLPAPHLGGDAADLDRELTPDTTILIVSDRDTTGLGGPLRADRRPAPGERPDFVQFVRNSGAPRDRPASGGTYGFGKGILYLVSKVSTIVVDTNTAQAGTASRRLIGCSVGRDRFDRNDHGLTGRHWWGDIVDGVPEPLLDDTASDTADRLGLPGFGDGRTGTDIVVIAPNLDKGRSSDHPRSRQAAAEFMASSLLWHLWPKMVAGHDGRAMRFAVDVDGADVALPDPATTELAPFVRALTRVRDDRAEHYRRTIAPKDAGRFALEIDLAADATTPPDARERQAILTMARPFTGPSHHVARMRSPELVVDYLETVPHPNPELRYGAVFRATEDADAHFAAAEPPTHDAWIEKELHGTDLGVVRNARSFVHRQVEAALAPRTQTAPDAAGMGRLSARLGALMIPSRGSDVPTPSSTKDGNDGRPERKSGGSEPPAPGTSGTGRGRTARIVDGPRLHVIEGEDVVVVARVAVPGSDDERALTAEANVVVDGVPERQPPLDAPIPDVIGWSPVQSSPDPPKTPFAKGATVRIAAGADADWWVLATAVPDAVVAVRIRAAQGRHRAP